MSHRVSALLYMREHILNERTHSKCNVPQSFSTLVALDAAEPAEIYIYINTQSISTLVALDAVEAAEISMEMEAHVEAWHLAREALDRQRQEHLMEVQTVQDAWLQVFTTSLYY